ncbi:hypothetical protein GT354_12880 [Streptomyces sp. SID3343]|nr:ATP-binding protein [Streptomyces sp. SID3343]MYV99162.1 hypothetical protein [Streptomyces sp. SID3343]
MARDHVAKVCALLGIGADEAKLAVSELATNALEHTRSGPISLHWWIDGRWLVVEVSDAELVPLHWSAHGDAPAVEAECGRGLEIVAAVADALTYGATHDGGKWVRVDFLIGKDVAARLPEQVRAMERPSWRNSPPPAPRPCRCVGVSGTADSETIPCLCH